MLSLAGLSSLRPNPNSDAVSSSSSFFMISILTSLLTLQTGWELKDERCLVRDFFGCTFHISSSLLAEWNSQRCHVRDFWDARPTYSERKNHKLIQREKITNWCKCHLSFSQTHLKLFVPLEFVKGQNRPSLYCCNFALTNHSTSFTVIVMLLRITWICPMTFDNFPLDVQVLSFYWSLAASQ